MNSFGRLFRIGISGESHGECVAVVIDGCPAGVALSPADFLYDLERRRGGKPGTTGRAEEDAPLIKSGLFKGYTTGAPVLILFENRDVDSTAYEAIKMTPRPGHADFTAHRKYRGFNDYRGGGHFSGRLTAALVASGVVAKKLIHPALVTATLVEAGGNANMDAAVRCAVEEGDSVGGLVECRVTGLPVGLGEPFFDSVESLISHAVFSIPGIKGIEFGAGFRCAGMKGSLYNDPLIDLSGRTATNNAGGIHGGITNGNDLLFRVAVKPTSSISLPQRTVNLADGERTSISVGGRHDACIALRIPVIVEAAAAVVLADLLRIEGNMPAVKEGSHGPR
jgi:chorismate synthase